MDYRRKILIVDDSAVNRMILSKILSSEFDILEAENGRAALDMLSDCCDSISLILLDIVMPVMDGYSFIEIFKNSEDMPSIPIIIETKSSGDQDEVKALSAGAADFITKPYKPEIIKRRVRNIINLKEKSAFINKIEKDILTSLYTKEAFYTRAASAMKQNPEKSYYIVCMDIENFHIINDVYGEAEGDSLLRSMAEAFNTFAARNYGIAGRLGGDIFVSLLPVEGNCGKEIMENLKTGIIDERLPKNVVVKYGIYRAWDRTLTVRAMCDKAQFSVQSIKGKYGVNCAFYDEAMGRQTQNELEITNEMKQALKDGQFKVYFQPKFDIATEEITGAEALVRWAHPQKGIISPAYFIPLFEKNGFITELDFYVWEQTCCIIKKWKDEGKKLFPVSVNVSRVDIYNEDLPELLLGLVKKYDLQPNLLHLEITETAYISNQSQLVSMIPRLRESGFIIEMDDFGSGFSSLSMLCDIKVDVIKLDINFLKNRGKSLRTASVVKHIIMLCNDLNVPTVAEGIETKEDLVFLRELSCKLGQGYYFSKPLPALSFAKLIETRKIQDMF